MNKFLIVIWQGHAYFRHRMIILALAILANLSIGICFKFFGRLGIDPFAAIVSNYWTAVILGCMISGDTPVFAHSLASSPWTIYSMALAVIFIISFNVAAYSVKYAGMAVTVAMQRMSLLVSAGYAIIFFAEPLGPLKVAGIFTALIAIVLITYKPKNIRALSSRISLLLPLCTLISSGVVESLLYHIHAHDLAVQGDIVFTTYTFSIAGCIGTLVLLVRYMKRNYTPRWRDLAGGIVLGVPNFFSIYLILTLLEHGFPGSVLYPVLNVMVLALTTIVSLYIFREQLLRINIIGLLVALLAIAFISLSI